MYNSFKMKFIDLYNQDTLIKMIWKEKDNPAMIVPRASNKTGATGEAETHSTNATEL